MRARFGGKMAPPGVEAVVLYGFPLFRVIIFQVLLKSMTREFSLTGTLMERISKGPWKIQSYIKQLLFKSCFNNQLQFGLELLVALQKT